MPITYLMLINLKYELAYLLQSETFSVSIELFVV
ncbi:MAG: hypothetical protein CLLPBCKN_005406 [Chroococcidiopsis cubana SAG 39.79]|nr:hypothetical protein [Chroococcidiopsis cubana SAG 39.79]